MREILFRGKRVDNGEWVHGDLLTKGIDFECAIRVHGANELNSSAIIQVYPESVGQYTGKNDKNGEMIFEGDIVDVYGHIDHVLFACGCFLMERQIRKVEFTHQDFSLIAVIGNTYDNPELLDKKRRNVQKVIK